MQHGPQSARGELQSHPLAGQAQACGRPHRWKGLGPDGTCRGHWLIPLHNISRFVHDLAPDHAGLLCIIPSEKLLGLCSSSLRRRRSKNWQELRPIYRRDSNPSIVHDFHTSLPYRHTSPRSNNPVIHSLDSAKKKKTSQGPCCSKKKTICTRDMTKNKIEMTTRPLVEHALPASALPGMHGDHTSPRRRPLALLSPRNTPSHSVPLSLGVPLGLGSRPVKKQWESPTIKR